jgi:predicted amidohydrolase YtcJ
MRLRGVLAYSAVVLGACVACWMHAATPGPQSEGADTIVVHARIYTLSPRQRWAEALAIRDGHILSFGNDREIGRFRGSKTKVIDAQGHLVLPGFTDSHLHFLEGAEQMTQVDLSDMRSIKEMQAAVKKYADAHPSEPWILGGGWNYEVFGASALPDKKYLDEVVPDRPVLLDCFDGHSSWANSKALELAGITRTTPDPPMGTFVRDPKTGEATGALKEFAEDKIKEKIPPASREEQVAAIRRGLEAARRAGVTRAYSLEGDFEAFDIYNELRQKGELTMRISIAKVVAFPELRATDIAALEAARAKWNDDWISAGAVKFFLDGVVEAHSAAMLAPYSDDPSQSGTMFWAPEKYKQAVLELDRRGFQIFTHAIGDRAVRLALDAYAAAHLANHHMDSRDRVEHVETIAAVDIPRFHSLGVIASMQPLHAEPVAANTLDVWSRNVGPQRAELGFAWHSILAAGGRLAFGSDWPVVTIRPWDGLQTAVTRQNENGYPPGGWIPQEKITLPQAIAAYTIGAAYAGRREATEGSFDVGKVADLIILADDIFKMDPHQLHNAKVALTMVGGKVVYTDPGWDASSHGKSPAKAGGKGEAAKP